MIVPFPPRGFSGGRGASAIGMARDEVKNGFVPRPRSAPRVLPSRKLAPIKQQCDVYEKAMEWLDELETYHKPFDPRLEKVKAKRKAKLDVDDSWEVIIQSVIDKIPVGEENMMSRPQIMKTTRIGVKDKKNYLAFVIFAEIAERPGVITDDRYGKPYYYREA